MTNILSWIAAALLGAASAVVLALLVWNGFLYLEYLRQPPLARPFSHGSFALVGDDDDWTFKPRFPANAPFPSVLLAPQQRAMTDPIFMRMAWQKAPGDIFRKIGRPSRAAQTLMPLANQPTCATRSWAFASAAVAGCAGS